MYHHFTPRKSPQQETITQKLNQLLDHYQYLKSLQPKNQFNELLIGPTMQDEFCVSVQCSLYNEKHKCRVFWLSNDKVVRYDEGDEVFEEIDGLEEADLISMQVLDIGETQRYLVVGEKGITIFSVVREKHEKKPQSLQQVQKIEMFQNQPQIMEEESSSQLIKGKPQFSQNFSLNKIKSQPFFQAYNNILERQKPQIYLDKIRQRRLQSAKAFVVKDLGLVGRFQRQEEEIKEEGNIVDHSERVFVVVSFKMAGKSNMSLVVYELTLMNNQQLKTRMKAHSDFTVFMQSPNGQILQITHVQFPNNEHFIQLALSYVQIPFDPQKQSQHINPVEVTESHAKFTHSNLVIECDLNFVKPQGSKVAMFSVYYVTQAIAYQMEPGEERHYVFEFRLAIDVKECMVVSKQNVWGSPVYEYPERQVMCPAKVYCLPMAPSTQILCYINVTKTLSFTSTHKNHQYQPISYKFTTVTMLEDKKLQFTQVQHRIIEDQEGILKRNYRNVLNQEHRRWNVRVDEKIVFGEMILVDLVRQYALMLVREEKVEIRDEFIPKGKFIGNNSTRNESRIVAINLRQNLSPNHKRVCSQFTFRQSHDHLNPSIHLQVDSLTSTNFLTYHQISIQTQPTVINNSLRHNKSLSLMYGEKEFVLERVDVVPKAMVYCDMLEKLFGKRRQKENEMGDRMKEENEGDRQKCNVNGMDAFFATIIDLLEP